MNLYSDIRNYFTGRSKRESLRSIRKRNISGKQIVNQEVFDHIYACIFSEDRLVVMRSIAAAMKITAAYPEYLLLHKESLLNRLDHSENKKFKWHLAVLAPRLRLTKTEIRKAWRIIAKWVMDKNESRVARIISIQALIALARQYPALLNELSHTIQVFKNQNILPVTTGFREFA